MADDELSDAPQFAFAVPPVLGEGDGLEPELGKLPVAPNIDVRRFGSVGAEKDKAVGSDSEDSRHGSARLV